MSLLLLGKHKALAILSSGASIRKVIGDIRLKHPTPLHSLHKTASRQQPCYSAAPGPASPTGARSLQMQDLDEQAVELVRQIHRTNRKAVFYVAGGGVQARSRCSRTFTQCLSVSKQSLQRRGGVSIAHTVMGHISRALLRLWCTAQVLTWLLSVPGASKTVLEARIPYGGGKSMAEILGKEPETYASTLTAVEMARAAYRQAAHLSEFGVPILGVSCTCALATDRVKKGDHKVTPILNLSIGCH